MLEVGFARADITTWEPGTCALGWGQETNFIEGIGTRLYVRAMVVRGPAGTLAYACADLCFVSTAVWNAVIERLAAMPSRGLGPHDVVLTATHTHSGPGGFSHHVTYNGSSLGFCPTVFETIVRGFVEAILGADDARRPATLRVGEAHVPYDEPVAFNRSIEAYNRNRDVGRVDGARTELGTRRLSVTLRADDTEGRTLGILNWFGVHGTSVHADARILHGDNKGLAALRFEAQARRDRAFAPGFVAIFAQEAAGDVSPNGHVDEERGVLRGTSEDDLESAAQNAVIQVRYARQAFEAARGEAALEGPIGGHVRRIDFADAAVSPEHADGFVGQRTRKAVLGLGATAGTAEGPGPARPVESILRAFTRARAEFGRMLGREVDPKLPFLEVGRGVEGQFLGLVPTRAGFPLVAPRVPTVAFVEAADRAGEMGSLPWVPEVLPLQIARIGSLVLVALPCEPTTVAGERIRRTVAEALAFAGVSRIVIAPYANGYAGYVTTREEYEAQHYEGASTLFGPWTLAAYQTALADLATAGLREGLAKVEGPELALASQETLVRQRIAGREGVSARSRGVAPGFHPGPVWLTMGLRSASRATPQTPGLSAPGPGPAQALDPGSMNCASRSSSNRPSQDRRATLPTKRAALASTA
ncbi:neutral/alkaline non-lysosomal ceramidase N-terminal domain-containing protein [Polyangium jinanense]|uniref:Neutral ceramidase n=1 Tax=Polyangium jinanense TaxID=2829994 RepID=A0A9X4AX29_9BACT|nr:neutral/alkaline non-lysosomal ceramidase N-terminal domain-containing protein [Polyangium jinanense]MDC3987998.1 neutral/alkaline non-lysosomal ceramidase N-terminal domain-containing protein [Polyangium jinanense]